MKYIIKRNSTQLKGDVALKPTKSIGNKVLVLRVMKNANIAQRINSERDDAQMVDHHLFADGQRGDVRKAVRYARAVLNYFGGEWLVSSSSILKKRSAKKFAQILEHAGVNIRHEEREGRPPIRVVAKNVRGNVARVDGTISSKMAEVRFIFPSTTPVEALHTLKETIYKSNYINLSLKALQRLGVNTDWSREQVLVEQEVIDGSELILEADWSLASYWYLWVALMRKAKLNIDGLEPENIQPDQAVKELFSRFGVKTEVHQQGILLRHDGKPTRTFAHHFGSYPNLIPSMVVACVGLGIPFIISGIEPLHKRDPDRIWAMQRELKKVGAQIEVVNTEQGETLNFNGKSNMGKLKDIEFDTYDEGRLVLALTALAAKGPTVRVNNPLVVNKSYMNFWGELRRLGISVETEQ